MSSLLSFTHVLAGCVLGAVLGLPGGTVVRRLPSLILALDSAEGAAEGLPQAPFPREEEHWLTRWGLRLAGPVIGAAAVMGWGLTPQAVLLAVIGLLLTWCVVIDMRHMLLPDALVLPLLGLGLVAATQSWFVPPESAIWGLILGYGLPKGLALGYSWKKGVEGLGGGDPKLLAALGTVLGPLGVLHCLLAASLGGLAVVVALRLSRRAALDGPVPFGPALCLAAVAVFMAQSAELLPRL